MSEKKKTKRMMKCPYCLGNGMVYGSICGKCKGVGEVEEY